MQLDRITNQLVIHEGLRLKPYECTEGKLTIGVGRNLEDRGITKNEAMAMLSSDILELNNQLTFEFPFYSKLDDIRQEVVLNMAFQMGLNGLKKFKKTLSFISEGNYFEASKEMLNSKWASQTPNRAKELSNLMKGDTQWNF